MPAAVIPITQSQSAPTFMPPKNWGFSQASYAFKATKMVGSDRCRELERRGSYFACTNHDYKQYDFDGRYVKPGPWTLQQPLMSNQAAPFYVPLASRKPCAPVRLGKQIVASFTKLTFGEDRFPALLCKEDEDTQDFVTELALACSLQVRMIQARNNAGSQGASGLSWYIHEGVPIVEVHESHHLHVHEWRDAVRWKPNHVTKCYKHRRSVWDPDEQRVVDREYWYRRDWTPQADVFYKEVEVKGMVEPAWEIDEERSDLHGDGFCHFVWMQNVPSSDPDGQPDYAGQYEKLDELDTINSVVCRGGKLNLDPTLALRMEPEAVGSAMVKKGSDHALVTGEKGDAKYLEISGQSLEAGGKLVDRLKQQVLDEAECVVTDPDKVAAGAVAAVALQMVYAPMMSKVSLIRETAGEAMRELLTQILHVCQARWTETVETTDAVSGDVTTEEVTNFLMLDPRVEEEEEVDPVTGEKTGEVSIEIKEREPGTGKRVKLSWGPCFKPNSIDVQNTVTAMSLAAGGKAVLSQRTAVEVVCSVIGKDPKVVMEELDGDHSKELAVNGSMFGLPSGDGMTQPAGKPGEAPPLPAGAPAAPDASSLDPEQEFQKGLAKEKGEHPELDQTAIEKLVLDHLEQDPASYSKPATPLPGQPAAAPVEAPEKPKLSLTSTDLGAIITVNEARAQYGFGAWPDEDGNLSLAEFKVKHGKLVSGSAMADKGQDPNKPPPAPAAGFGGPPGGKPGFGKKAPTGVAGAAEPGDVEEPEGVVSPKKKPPFGK